MSELTGDRGRSSFVYWSRPVDFCSGPGADRGGPRHKGNAQDAGKLKTHWKLLLLQTWRFLSHQKRWACNIDMHEANLNMSVDCSASLSRATASQLASYKIIDESCCCFSHTAALIGQHQPALAHSELKWRPLCSSCRSLEAFPTFRSLSQLLEWTSRHPGDCRVMW